MIRFLFQSVLSGIFLIAGLSFNGTAASYYWRAAPSDNLFTNVGNWETSPGGGLSPSLAPGVNDDVFFPVASTVSSINLNGGNCRDFSVTAAGPASFTFTGILTAINGSLLCPNGNATFNFGGVQNFIGSGSHTINIGTSAVRLFGFMTFANGSGTGTYTLSGPLNTNAILTFSSQNFNTNGFPLSAYQIIISGSTSKTINCANSAVSINKQGAFGSIQFLSSHLTTTYNFSGTDITINDSSVASKSALIINPGVAVSFDTLTFNKTVTTSNASVINVGGSSPTPATLSVNMLRINIPNLTLGGNSFDNTTAARTECILNIGSLVFLQPSSILADRTFTLNVGGITESPVCGGQSSLTNVGYASFTLNTTTPLSTANIVYYGISFGGSGLTTSSSNDLGNNTGAVTWSAPIAGISYWWVGGNGNWSDPTEWSIAGSGGAPQTTSGCIPTIYDSVIFDAASFSGSQTVSLADRDAFCRGISWSGSNQGLLTGGKLLSGDIFQGNLFIRGNAGFSGARGIEANLFFVGSDTNTILSGAFFTYTSPAIRIMGTGMRTLSDNLIGSASGSYLQHTSGTLNTAGNTVDVAYFCSRSLPELPGNMRTLMISNSQINIRNAISGVVAGRRHLDVSFLSGVSAANSDFRIHSSDPSSCFILTKGSTSSTFLSTVNLHNISFTATTGTPLFAATTAGGGTYSANFNDVSFASNGNINCAANFINHSVNHYNFVSGATYAFSQASGTSPTFNISGGINHSVSGCQELVRVQSALSGSRARISKAAAPFTLDGAIITDIDAVGTTLNVLNGVDAGNNLNVSVSAATSRTLYWVNNAGSWNDGAGHWSIGVSGASPAVTNPLGCVPRVVDDVIFDNNSFSIPAQAVTLNVDGNCRNMLWTAAAGSDAPVFAGASSRNLNVYGSIELASGMSSSFLGRTYMLGGSTTALAQSIDMNGVNTNGSIWLSGGGRYDLTDSVRIVASDQGIRLERGNFVTNGNRIYAGAMFLDVSTPNAADISNSFIRLFSVGNSGIGSSATYSAFHNAGASWSAAGSTIQSDQGSVLITNLLPVSYGNVIMNSTVTPGITGSATQPLSFNKIDWLQTPPSASGGSRLDGIFLIDTLMYPLSSLNTFQTGGLRSYTINDTMVAYGTPCNPTFLRSAVAGSPASLSSSSCNFDFNFVNLRDITAASCTAAQNKTIGTDEGGNSNWTITGIPGLTKLGNDTGIVCGGPNITLDAIGFGSIPGILYNWNTGSTARSIAVNTADTYAVVVTYGAGCLVSDSLIVTCSSVLPLSGLVLKGGQQQGRNMLNWQTLSEQGLHYFLVERSGDGVQFDVLAKVGAHGSSSFPGFYEFTDAQAPPGINLYRVRQYDVSGRVGYSNTIRLFSGANGSPEIVVYPNPSNKEFTVLFPVKDLYRLSLNNLLGQTLWAKEMQLDENDLNQTFQRNSLPAGQYLLRVESAVLPGQEPMLLFFY